MDTSKFYVIAVVSNPVMYKSRYELFKKFKAHMDESKVKMITVELAFGDRPFEVTESNNPYHLQLRTIEELWHKENMINLGINRLSQIAPDWQQLAWVDADVSFVRKDWVKSIVQSLQHYQVIQPWTNAIDLGPNGESLKVHFSFMHQYITKRPYSYGGKYEHWHPGYAWAANRDAINHLGQLIDIAILGAGDNHMAHALIGRLDGTIAKGLHPSYIEKLRLWQNQAERFIRRDVGFLPGTIVHDWHGKKKDRKYHDRWKILVSNQYNPDTDLKRDAQGLYQLVDHGDLRSINLRDDIRDYFRARNEDSIDLE
jgi:hypothetical protein